MKIKDYQSYLPKDKQTNMFGYVIYARKSSEAEDKQMASIDSQLEILNLHAQKNDLTVIQTFSESRSAKKPGRKSRPAFYEMLDYVNANDNIKGILCWKLNRLSRNPEDEGKLRQVLSDGRIEEIVTPTKTYHEADSDFIMAVEGAQAQRFIRDLREDTARGINRKLDNGHYPGLAPVGYINDKNMRQGEKTISPHPIYFSLMGEIFRLALTGKYSVIELVAKAEKLGIKNSRDKAISTSRMYEVLKNPFYAGKFVYAGKLYQGAHKPLVTAREFDALQDILEGNSKSWVKQHSHSLKGILKCGHCGYQITAETHTKKSGLKFTYYTCSQTKKGKCKQGFARDNELEQQVSDFLGTLKLSNRFVEWASKWLKETESQDRQVRTSKFSALRSEHTQLELRLNNLTDKWLEGLLDDEAYQLHSQRYKQRRADVLQELAKADDDWDKWTDLAVDTFKFAKEAQSKWDNGSPEDKKNLLRLIGSNLILKDKSLEITAKAPFKLISEANIKASEIKSSSNPDIEDNFRDTSGLIPVWGE